MQSPLAKANATRSTIWYNNIPSGGRIVPPLSLSELQQHADTIATIHRLPRSYRHWLTVLINNQLWREPLGAIPYFRRLLLLPQCLRPRESCPAKMDAIGLLCQQCGPMSDWRITTSGRTTWLWSSWVAEGTDRRDHP